MAALAACTGYSDNYEELKEESRKIILVIFGGIIPLCDSILVEIKCINVRRNATVFSNC
jgi:hypothetical protein